MKSKNPDLKTWIITLTFYDGQNMKYVIKREQFWQAKEEAEETKSVWSDVRDYHIKEEDPPQKHQKEKQNRDYDNKKSRRNKIEFE